MLLFEQNQCLRRFAGSSGEIAIGSQVVDQLVPALAEGCPGLESEASQRIETHCIA